MKPNKQKRTCDGDHLGTFAFEEAAALAYNAAARERYGDFARLNDVPPASEWPKPTLSGGDAD